MQILDILLYQDLGADGIGGANLVNCNEIMKSRFHYKNFSFYSNFLSFLLLFARKVNPFRR